ncbi:MAG: helix-turn-helix transcriptional regulator [Rhodococcus sp. (in: high G+C Gram-positive bacteria)]|uniref:helix-turn-helix transcriptional regulator n=1 Tax=Rhodococcus sp. TaxID=1831 RepID=UPI003BB573EC
MAEKRTAGALRSSLRDIALATASTSEFGQAALRAVRTRIPFDRGCIGTVDPATLMLTSVTMMDVPNSLGRGFASVAELEYGTSPYANAYGRLAREPGGAQTIRDAVAGDIRETLPYGQILEPLGMDDEVRLVFRGRDDRVWGAGTLMRGPGHRFGDTDVRALAACGREIGEGLRLPLIRQTPRMVTEVSDGPAVVVVGEDDEVESVTPRASEYLDRIGGDSCVRMMPAVASAVRFRNSGEAVVTRVRTADGEWLVLRAGRLDGRGARGRVVVTVEPAQPAQIIALVTELHRLTARESEVLGHVLACETRTEIGQRMFISPYTVQDHLKSIYAKIGVNSRQELVAHLFYSHHLPHFGASVGPDGWFAGVHRRDGHGSEPNAP